MKRFFINLIIIFFVPAILGIIIYVPVEYEWFGLSNPPLQINNLSSVILNTGYIVALLMTIIYTTFQWNKLKAIQLQKRLELNRQANEQSWQSFFNWLNHEIKNPVQIIELGVQHLQGKLVLSTEENKSCNRSGGVNEAPSW